MPDQDGDKKHDPTQHRRQEARKQGQVAKSQDLGSALLLVVGIVLLIMLGAGFVESMGALSSTLLGGEPWLRTDVGSFNAFMYTLTVQVAKLLVPVFLVLFIAAVLVNLIQVGVMFLPEKLAFDFSRLDMIKGAQRMFSMQALVRLGMGILKIAIASAVALVVLYNEAPIIIHLAQCNAMDAATYLCSVTLWTSLKVALALLLLSIADYGFQFWKHEQDLKMTDQEMRDEMKNLEGDPQVVAKRRQVQRQLAQNRTAQAVPSADVVVTNPTELAVAIQYDPTSMAAPVVVAKGAGLMAQRIRRIALEHGIPIVEKKPLAQALYRDVEVDDPVPSDKYAAVAEVLAYVYQLKGKKLPGQAA